MNKKNFKTSFNDLLCNDLTETKGINKKKDEKETKATFVVKCDQLDKLRAISYMERKMIKSVLEEALMLYIEKYKRDNGDILLPKK